MYPFFFLLRKERYKPVPWHFFHSVVQAILAYAEEYNFWLKVENEFHSICAIKAHTHELRANSTLIEFFLSLSLSLSLSISP